MVIDRSYFRIDLAIFFRDLLIPLAIFPVSFVIALNSTGPLFIASYVVTVIAIHRCGCFLHEISHYYHNPDFLPFRLFWDLTVGAIAQVPSARFVKPHTTHHSMRIFATRDDPQYMLLRSDRKLAVVVLLVIPFIMPFFNLVLVAASCLGSLDLEGAVERYLAGKGIIVGSSLPDEYRKDVTRLGRYYLVLFVLYAAILPETLPLLYAVLAGGWFLAILRIPLEHSFMRHKTVSDKRDHITDSFTFESPFAALLQPNNLRFHTAHHMYPGVPYHNLPALHGELKKNQADYRRSIRTYREAVHGFTTEQTAPLPEAMKE